MKGLYVDANRGFYELFGTVLDSLASHYWLVDAASGPFHISDKPDFFELLDQMEQHSVRVPLFEDTSTHLFRPSIFPGFAPLLVVDEWTRVFGLAGPEQEAIKAAEGLNSITFDNPAKWLSPEYFDCVQDRTSVFFLHVDGWWEAYAHDLSILANLRQVPSVHEIDSDKWANYNWDL